MSDQMWLRPEHYHFLEVFLPFLSTVLCITSFASNSWIQTDSFRNQWGLWKRCLQTIKETKKKGKAEEHEEEQCMLMATAENEPYFLAAQTMACFALICFALGLFSSWKTKDKKPCFPGFRAAFLFTLAVGFSVVEMVLIVSGYKNDPRWSTLSPNLGWCFWMHVAVTCLGMLAALVLYRRGAEDWKVERQSGQRKPVLTDEDYGMLEFLLPIVCCILYTLGFAAQNWVAAVSGTNSTIVSTWGLWNNCTYTNNLTETHRNSSLLQADCGHTASGDSDPYFEFARAGSCFALICFVLQCLTVFRKKETACRLVQGFVPAAITSVAVVLTLAVLVAVGAGYKNDSRWRSLSPSLGWCYWMHVSAAVVGILTVAVLFRRARRESRANRTTQARLPCLTPELYKCLEFLLPLVSAILFIVGFAVDAWVEVKADEVLNNINNKTTTSTTYKWSLWKSRNCTKNLLTGHEGCKKLPFPVYLEAGRALSGFALVLFVLAFFSGWRKDDKETPCCPGVRPAVISSLAAILCAVEVVLIATGFKFDSLWSGGDVSFQMGFVVHSVATCLGLLAALVMIRRRNLVASDAAARFPTPDDMAWTAFLLPIICTVLYVAGFASNNWIEADGSQSNATFGVYYSWGLWKNCTQTSANRTDGQLEEQCDDIRPGDSNGYYEAARVFGCFALICYMLQFLSVFRDPKKEQQCKLSHGYTPAQFTSAAVVLTLVVLVTVGTGYKNDSHWKSLSPSLGWCYWLHVAAAVLGTPTAALLFLRGKRELKDERARRAAQATQQTPAASNRNADQPTSPTTATAATSARAQAANTDTSASNNAGTQTANSTANNAGTQTVGLASSLSQIDQVDFSTAPPPYRLVYPEVDTPGGASGVAGDGHFPLLVLPRYEMPAESDRSLPGVPPPAYEDAAQSPPPSYEDAIANSEQEAPPQPVFPKDVV